MKNWLINTRHLRSRVNLFLLILCMIAAVIVPNSVSGKMKRDAWVSQGDTEFNALPRWCQIRMMAHRRMGGLDDNVPDSVMRENEKWRKFIGNDNVYFRAHHYCVGLTWIIRYKTSLLSKYKGVESDRIMALNLALEEFKFMGHKRCKKSNLYIPLLMNEAYVYGEQKDFEKAVKNYREIIKVKPSYAVAYVKYAQLLNSVGRNTDAIKVLQTGLKKTKGAKDIKRAMTAMGGGKE